MRSAQKKGSSFVDPTGWRLDHCGHPTALWPYALHSPPGHPAADRNVMSFNGCGFQTKKAALQVLRDIVDGKATVTIERCDGRTACVVGRTSAGAVVDDDRRAATVARS